MRRRWVGRRGDTAGKVNGKPGEWAGKVMPLEELTALLARFGMIVGLDASPEADKELQAAQLAHALVGVAEGTPPAPSSTRTPELDRPTSLKPPCWPSLG